MQGFVERRDMLFAPEPSAASEDVRAAARFGIALGLPLVIAGFALLAVFPAVARAWPGPGRLLGIIARVFVLPLVVGWLFFTTGVYRLINGSPHSAEPRHAVRRGITVVALVAATGLALVGVFELFVASLS